MSMKRKRVISLLMGLILAATILSSCNKNNDFINGYFYCKAIGDKKIAIGDVSSDFSADYIFVEREINGYVVSKLGFKSGFGFGGNGYLTSYKLDEDNKSGYKISRFYCPNTISDIEEGYMKYTNDLSVFYCGECINLELASGDNINWYVPSELYEEYKNLMSVNRVETLNKANVLYDLNYDTDNKYYYVDNYEYGSSIEFIPPSPIRSDYEFIGWYKEKDSINEWDFDSDKLPLLEEKEFIETKLYAKWQKK